MESKQIEMKQKTLTTVALLAATFTVSLAVTAPVQASQVVDRLTIQSSAASQNSNNSNHRHMPLLGLTMTGTLIAIGCLGVRRVLSQKTSVPSTIGLNEAEKQSEISTTDAQRQPSTATPPSAYVERVYAHFGRGNTIGAIADFNEAIQSHPGSAYLHSERANFRCKSLHDPQGALEDYNAAIRIHPHNALFYLWRSQVYHTLGDQRRAIEDYNKALKLSPADTVYHSF